MDNLDYRARAALLGEAAVPTGTRWSMGCWQLAKSTGQPAEPSARRDLSKVPHVVSSRVRARGIYRQAIMYERIEKVGD